MDKLKIAICDDETADLAQAFALVEDYDLDQQLQISIFQHASELLENIQDQIDIVLMDIEMDPPNGFDVAKRLIRLNNPPVIIFTTKSNAYTLKGYGVAIRYVQKPLQKLDLFEALDIAISEAVAHRLTFESNDTTYAIHLRDIYYIEIFGHYASIHTPSDEFRIRSTLKEITAKLPRGYFAFPHKSYVVNLEHIISATSSEIQLKNGAKIPISRRKAPEFNEAFYRFLGR